MNDLKFQPIHEIGYPGLIQKLSAYTGSQRNEVIKGIGDDAVIFASGSDEHFSASTEIFLEGVHFDLTYHPFHHLGYKVVTAAVSHIYAMNARPFQLLVNIAVPNMHSVEMVEKLYEGIENACNDYQVQIAGGDTTASHQWLAISVTAIGKGKKENIIYRHGARDGDLICVTGDMGAAMAGLRILMREKKEWKDKGDNQFSPDFENYEYVIKRQLFPAARKDIIGLFEEHGITPRSMTVITQGLVHAVRNIAVVSSLGADIFLPAIPISPETRQVADEMQEDVDKYAFYGGEDYELMFTIPEPKFNELEKICDDFVVIGKMTGQKNVLKIDTGGDETVHMEL
jgi:thiamine-monophosphate kinase